MASGHMACHIDYTPRTRCDHLYTHTPEVQNLPRAPPRGGGNFSFLGKFFIFREIFGVFLCEPLDLLLFKKGNFSNKLPRGRKFDRSAADSAPLSYSFKFSPQFLQVTKDLNRNSQSKINSRLN
jgi:hypothetical protein